MLALHMTRHAARLLRFPIAEQAANRFLGRRTALIVNVTLQKGRMSKGPTATQTSQIVNVETF